MRRFVFTSLLLLATIIASAKPAMPGVKKTLTLADGRQIEAELCGDEFAHFWRAADGTAYIKVEDSAVYAAADMTLLREEALAKRSVQDALVAARQTARKKVTFGGDHTPYTGQKNMLLILVNFTDYQFAAEHNKEYYQRLCNAVNFTDGEGNVHSVRDYFLAQSGGQLDITFDVAGPVQLEHDHAYYGGRYATYGYQLVQAAVEGAHNEGIDFSQYDWDGDGEVDQVYIIFAGHDQSSYDDDTLLWGMTDKLGTLRKVTYDGVTINTYAWSGELAGSGAADGIGSMCHEFSHCLGLPDVYDVYYGEGYGMWYWDVMDRGCYNGDLSGYIPAGYTSYERMYCGWQEPIALTDDVSIADMRGLTEGGEAYIIYNSSTPTEYYLLENRSNYDFDSALPAHGLLIIHIDYNSRYWSSNVVNTMYNGNDHERYRPIACDDSYVRDDMATDIWPSVGNRLDNSTSPAATLYNANSDGGYYMNITLEDITLTDDGTVAFTFHPYGTTEVTLSPVDGATVDILQTVTISSSTSVLSLVGDAAAAVAYDADATVVATATPCAVVAADGVCHEITLTFSPALTDKGDYTIVIPEGYYRVGALASDEHVLHYTVVPPLALAFSPANGATVETLATFEITCDDGLVQNKWDNLEVCTAENEYVTYAYVSKNLTRESDTTTQWIGFEMSLATPLRSEGEYHILLPEDYFILGDNADPVLSAGETLIYYVTGVEPEPEPEPDPDPDPEPGPDDGVLSVAADTAPEAVYYNTMGERVASPTHGVYIVNGRKVILP